MGRKIKKIYNLISAVIGSGIFLTGCNLFDRVDHAYHPEDVLAVATAKANAGDCSGAKDLLVTISNPNDDQLSALGWAYLCLAKASSATVATSLYQYSSSTNNLVVLSRLAQRLVPSTDARRVYIDLAIETFAKMLDQDRRNLQMAVAKLVRAAATLASQVNNADTQGLLEKTDIAPSSCAAQDCTTAPAACSEVMSDNDAIYFTSLVSEASDQLSALNTRDLQSLSLALKNGVAGGANAARCFIYNNIVQ